MRAQRLRSLARSPFRRAPRKLRNRLTLGLAVLLMVICAGVGLATTHLVGRFLLDRLDQQVTQAGPRYAASLEHGGSAGTDGGGGGIGVARCAIRVSTTVWPTSGTVSSLRRAAAAAANAGTPGVMS